MLEEEPRAERPTTVTPIRAGAAGAAPAGRKSQMQDAHVLVPDELRKALRANVRRGCDVPPVLKIFSPAGAATWLIHSVESDHDTLFGLCDLGMGFPELGSVSLQELQETTVPVRVLINGERHVDFRMQMERDLHFRPAHSMEVYAEAAREHDHITENRSHLEEASRRCQVRKPGRGRRKR